jgi:hypothetical protein
MADEGLIAMYDVEVICYVHQDGMRSPASEGQNAAEQDN